MEILPCCCTMYCEMQTDCASMCRIQLYVNPGTTWNKRKLKPWISRTLPPRAQKSSNKTSVCQSCHLGVSWNRGTPSPKLWMVFVRENPIVRNGWWLGVPLWLRKPPNGDFMGFNRFYMVIWIGLLGVWTIIIYGDVPWRHGATPSSLHGWLMSKKSHRTR